MNPTIAVRFRGILVEIPLDDALTVDQVRSSVAQVVIDEAGTAKMDAHDVKLMFKGKLLTDGSQNLKQLLVPPGTSAKKTYRFMAMGISKDDINEADQEFLQTLQRNKILVRDDLSTQGQLKELARRQLGRRNLLAKSRDISALSSSFHSNHYGFGSIEVLPDLADRSKARDILTALANDPGVKACMAKHEWHVGSLAELYPEGKVGQSPVCVMGLNRNKGQQILLRIRTDDLKGFRKIASIREVLYHELAHNVHSEHDSDFFQLMRQIKKECLEMDWTRGEGVVALDTDGDKLAGRVQGGTYTLCGNTHATLQRSARELAARAALERWSAEEEEVRQNCGCGHDSGSFTPPRNSNSVGASDPSCRER